MTFYQSVLDEKFILQCDISMKVFYTKSCRHKQNCNDESKILKWGLKSFRWHGAAPLLITCSIILKMLHWKILQ